jgi:cytoskeletal protein CcmA (bactofilin family)
MENNRLHRSELTVIASDVTLEGVIDVRTELHLYGKVIGEIRGRPGSTIVLKEGAVFEGKILGETLIVDGFVQGEIQCSKKIWITGLGKVMGQLRTPNLQIDPGAIFEAQVKM